MVADKKAKMTSLKGLLATLADTRSYVLFDPKKDGRVRIRFKSTDSEDAVSAACRTSEGLISAGQRVFTIDETNVSVEL